MYVLGIGFKKNGQTLAIMHRWEIKRCVGGGLDVWLQRQRLIENNTKVLSRGVVYNCACMRLKLKKEKQKEERRCV